MPYQLPFFPSVPNYRVATVLDGSIYILDVRWNGRDEAWYFDLLSSDETMIRAGIKIVLGAAMAGHVTDPAIPAGVFIATDRTGASVDAGIDDLGDRVVVEFWPLEEIV